MGQKQRLSKPATRHFDLKLKPHNRLTCSTLGNLSVCSGDVDKPFVLKSVRNTIYYFRGQLPIPLQTGKLPTKPKLHAIITI